MSDFLSEILKDDGVVTKQLTFNGKTGDVYFRRISAGEKASLLKGQKVQAEAGKASTFEVDLGENANTKALLVFYSVVNVDGTKRFKKLSEVQGIEAGKFEVLYDAAREVNKDDLQGDDAGKP